MRLIGPTEIRQLLPMPAAVVLMRKAFKMISRGSAVVADRQALPLSRGTGLLMGAADEEAGFAAKLVGVMPGNGDQGLPGSIGALLLLDPRTGEPLALMDGASLTAWRTAAANACAIDLLARRDARTALLVGCGTQAGAQLHGMTAVRRLDEIRVLGRSHEKARDFARTHEQGWNLVPAKDSQSALEGVDIVVSATTSKTPVIPGSLVPGGCHVSGVGSFRADMREFDRALLERASIYVEDRNSVLHEAGELIDLANSGLCDPGAWSEIGEVLGGEKPGRVRDDEVTFFKSVGNAVFDLVAARAIYDAAVEQDAGVRWQP